VFLNVRPEVRKAPYFNCAALAYMGSRLMYGSLPPVSLKSELQMLASSSYWSVPGSSETKVPAKHGWS
jgi:hypothetical protein